MKIETKYQLDPGTVIRVDSLLKRTGAEYYTHLHCQIFKNRTPTSEWYAIPITYFFCEPLDSSTLDKLNDEYSKHGSRMLNKNFDRNMFRWIKEKMGYFLFITVLDNISGPLNSNPSKMRPYPVWKYETEFTPRDCYND